MSLQPVGGSSYNSPSSENSLSGQLLNNAAQLQHSEAALQLLYAMKNNKDLSPDEQSQLNDKISDTQTQINGLKMTQDLLKSQGASIPANSSSTLGKTADTLSEYVNGLEQNGVLTATQANDYLQQLENIQNSSTLSPTQKIQALHDTITQLNGDTPGLSFPRLETCF